MARAHTSTSLFVTFSEPGGAEDKKTRKFERIGSKVRFAENKCRCVTGPPKARLQSRRGHGSSSVKFCPA